MPAINETSIQGIGVSGGTAIGKAFIYRPVRLKEHEERLADNPETEVLRLHEAKTKCLTELEELIGRTREAIGEEKAMILKGQISILQDPTFIPPMEKLIREEGWTAETALERIVSQIAELFQNMENEYMRERAADVRDVGNRLFAHLAADSCTLLSEIREPVIIVTDDLTPSDTVQLDRNLVLGIVTRTGGRTSHTAILAGSLGITAVLSAGDGIEAIRNGDLIIVNGSTGECQLHPGEETLRVYAETMETEAGERRELEAYAKLDPVTKDGYRIHIAANIGVPEEALDLLNRGAQSIGLFRTEFLYMNRSGLPGAEVQYQAYKAAVEAMRGNRVVIRTLDIGGDKELSYLDLPHEDNPFLGCRAIRLTLDRPELMTAQLRAAVRASAHGKLGIMFPMISGLEEWRQAKALFDKVCSELRAEELPYDENIEVGMMIETPSAAIMADKLAKEADFFSIGTNDLVQYTAAVDRMNPRVAYLYDYFHPAVIRLIKGVIDASNRHGKRTGMCGSMAGDPLAAPLLIGLGLHEWSMEISSVPKVKKTLAALNRLDCVKLTEKLLELDTAADVRAALQDYLKMA